MYLPITNLYAQRDINSEKALERQERNYNKKRSDITFDENEEVYMEISVPEPGIPEKFQKRRNGPYIITKKINNLLYAIKDPKSGKESYVCKEARCTPFYVRTGIYCSHRATTNDNIIYNA